MFKNFRQVMSKKLRQREKISNKSSVGQFLTATDGVEDKVPQGSVLLDTEVDQITENCLRNPVVVRKVLQHFSSTELLKLSLVNKLWNYESRTIMRKRGNIFLMLKCDGESACNDRLEALGREVAKMEISSFFGLSFDVTPLDRRCQNEATSSFNHEVILDRLPLKNVSIFLAWNRWRYKDCPTFLLSQKALKRFSETLEKLLLDIFDGREELIEEFVRDCSFPCLKVLKLGAHGASDVNFLKVLVSRAPNLQELHAKGPIDLLLNAIEGRPVVAVCASGVCNPFDEILEHAISSGRKEFRLERIRLIYTGHRFNFERFDRVTPILLRASCSSTLREIDVDEVLLMPFMRFGATLENVKNLTIHLNLSEARRIEPQFSRLWKDSDFTCTFPNLNKVTIGRDILPDHIMAIFGDKNVILEEPATGRAANIKELVFMVPISEASVQFLAGIFKNIEELEVIEYTDQYLFTSIWKHWLNLKGVVAHVGSCMVQNNGNLDSVFCGIFPEEVTELRKKDEGFLKEVNIVPVMPAITCLRNLRTLRLIHYTPRDSHIFNDGTFIFSKVTGLMAFARCPELTVTLETRASHGHEALGHMKPYASIIYR